jgi:cysteine desulfurase
MAYFDHAAATPVRQEVVEAITPLLTESFANPSAGHGPGRHARARLDDAREEIAELLGAGPGDVIFTSGGTESDNWAISATLERGLREGRDRAVISALEHKAVLEPAEHMAKRGTRLSLVAPTADGEITTGGVTELLDDAVALVSVMTANNEIGVINDLVQISRAVRKLAPQAVLHTDAVQSAPWCDLRDVTSAVDLLTISSHKLGGLKGTGVLVAKEAVHLDAFILGGAQELGRRAGTQDALGAVAMAVALRCAVRDREHVAAEIAALRDRFVAGLLARGAVRTVEAVNLLPGHAHVAFPGLVTDELLVGFDRAGLSASAGASCASGATELSHVVSALGRPDEVARGIVRFSLGRTTTSQDVEQALTIVASTVERLGGVRLSHASGLLD